VSGVPWRIITGFGLNDWIYWRLLCTISLNYNQYSANSDLPTFQFTVAHALGFSVSTSRCLVADLNTGTITSNHYEVFLSFFFNHLGPPTPWIRPNSPILSITTTTTTTTILASQIQSQSYFTTGGLPPVSSSWRQAPWDPRPEIIFNWIPAVIVLM
jgi:hypothetical protein